MKFSTFTVFDHYEQHLPRRRSTFLEEVLQQTQQAEKSGFDGTWFAEHHFSEYGINPSPPVFMAAAAERTRRIRLGVAVSVMPLHDPLRVAEDYAMVDVLSKGRLDLGLGSGYLPHEFAGFQVSTEDKAHRFNDALDVLLKAWTGQPFSHQGPYYQIPEVQLNLRPLQQPHPPFWIASLRKRGVTHIARRGAPIMGIAYVNSRSREELADVIRTYHKTYREHGHGDPDRQDIPVAFHVHVANTREEAEANAREPLNLYLGTRQYGQNIEFDDLKQRGQALVGSPEDVIRQIEAYREIGITHLMALMNFGGMAPDKVCRSLELFGKYVIPAFQKERGGDQRVGTYE